MPSFYSPRYPSGDALGGRNRFTGSSHRRSSAQSMPAARRLLRPYGSRHANRDFLVACVLAGLLTIGFGAWMALQTGTDGASDALRRFGEAGAALSAGGGRAGAPPPPFWPSP